MRIPVCFLNRCRRRRALQGFTLLELSIGMSTGMLVAGAAAGLLHQQMRTVEVLQREDWLPLEAPALQSVWSRLMRHTDTARIFPSVDAVLNGSGGGAAAGTAAGGAVVVRRNRRDGGTLDLLIGLEAPGVLAVYRRRGGGGAGTGFERLFDFGRGITGCSVMLDPGGGGIHLQVTGPHGEEMKLAVEQEK